MTIESNLTLLKEHQIEIKGTLRGKLKARHLEWMVNHINDPIAEELFQAVIQDRNERASINQNQSQDIVRKAGEIHQLDKVNNNLQQEVIHWQQKFDELFKQFLDLKESELVKLGQWLINGFSLQGRERINYLRQKDLVHKKDYNQVVADSQATIEELRQISKNVKHEGTYKISELEKVIDSRKQQLSQIRTYIINNHGNNEWNRITTYFKIEDDIENETN